jgi:Tfp pilus assembly protein FimV
MKFNAKLLALSALIVSSMSAAHADDTTYLSCSSVAGASMKCEGISLDGIMSREATASLTGEKQASVLFQCDRVGGAVQCHRMSVDVSMNTSAPGDAPAQPSGIMAVSPPPEAGTVPPGRMKPIESTTPPAASASKQAPVYLTLTKPASEGETSPKKAQPAKVESKAGKSASKTARVGPIRSGDTLISMIDSHYGGQGDRHDLMAAVFLANPNSFVNGNPSMLKTGAYLNMPPLADVKPGIWSEVSSSFYHAAKSSSKKPVQAREPSPTQASHAAAGIEPGDVVQRVNGAPPHPSQIIVSGDSASKKDEASTPISSNGGSEADRQALIEQVLKIQGQISNLQKSLPSK